MTESYLILHYFFSFFESSRRSSRFGAGLGLFSVFPRFDSSGLVMVVAECTVLPE
jgi:hypothetical protein